MVKSYRVTGSLRYRGYAPGETFTASLTPDEERRAIARGAIELLRRARGAERRKTRRPGGDEGGAGVEV